MIKINRISTGSERSLPRKRSGAALIIVLAILVLLVGLIVAFLTRTLVERGATDAYAASAATSRLADLTVNLVQGQIRDATTQGAAVAWTSQPGMIRTFGSGTPGSFAASDDLLRIFKLYSAQELVSTAYMPGDDVAPATWQDSAPLWTDLNSPVLVNNPAGGSPARVPHFPILDPGALNEVEGFDVITASAPAGSTPGNTESRRLPMPVRWIYVLQEGELIAPSETSGNTATISGATNDNPIIGRVAFWTDDETSKININTASEGTYWDVPRANTQEDWNLGNFQPAFNEFQAYPGHPALTSLAPVLFASSKTSTPSPLTDAQRDALYKIAPRIEKGGSEHGQVVATQPIPLDSDRLYASLDEMMFAATQRLDQPSASGLNREKLERAKFFLTASSQAPEVTLFNTPRVAMWPIFKDLLPGRVTAYDRLIAFCATINAQPYYFQRADARSTTADWAEIPRNRQLLRYLRALSSKPMPGFGETLVSKTSVEDRDQLLVAMMDYVRSTNLYDDNLSSAVYQSNQLAAARNAPQFTTGRRSGWAGVKVHRGHGNVAPLRVPAGLPNSSTYPSEPDKTSPMGFGRFHTISEVGLLFICAADGSAGTTVNPIGADSAETVAKRASNTLTGPLANRMLDPTLVLAPDERRVQMMLFFEQMNLMQGWTQYSVESSDDVILQGEFQINGNTIDFPSSASFDQRNTTGFDIYPWGGYMGFRKPLAFRYTEGDTTAYPPEYDNERTLYPLISLPFTVKVPGGPNPTMRFRGPDKILLKVYSKPRELRNLSDPEADLVQTIELNFPEADFPIPELKIAGTPTIPPSPGVSGTPGTPREYWWTFNTDGAVGDNSGRLLYIDKQPTGDSAGSPIWPEDTLRTLVPYHGDIRLVAGSHYVPTGVFLPSSGYYGTTRDAGNPLSQISNFFTGSNRSSTDGVRGKVITSASDNLVANAAYNIAALPKFPISAPSATAIQSARPFQQFGDFDNGVGRAVDGPFLNKPDEGNNNRTGTPYFSEAYNQVAGGATFFSPNRQVPGPGMFGSLPTRLMTGNQAFSLANVGNTWRTLLVRPQPGHPGASDPPDHLWLDFFWMPVVEPYAISSPFSTAGKINMNYGIEPFSYIRRATGIVALMRSERVMAIPMTDASTHKASKTNSNYRLPINAHETLKQFDDTFHRGEVFLSPSSISDIHLIPQGITLNSTGTNADSVMQTFWQNHALTGDNTRERPYTTIQGRLTTKSNTFTVHYRVQTLKKAPGSPEVWDEDRDNVSGELRGSNTIERYINPNEKLIPDYAEEYSDDPNSSPQDLGQSYRWRIVSSRLFTP